MNEINEILNSINMSKKLKDEYIIDEDSSNFLLMFLKAYKQKIKELSSTGRLKDIIKSFNEITPKKIASVCERGVYDLLLDDYSDVENGQIFLDIVSTNLIILILEMAFKCVLEFKQSIINRNCILYIFVNDKYLKYIANSLDILIPHYTLDDYEFVEKITNEELLEKLKEKYEDIDNFPKKFLYTLNKPFLEYTSYMKKFIEYSSIFNILEEYELESSDTYIKILFPNKISKEDIVQFTTNKIIRKYVVKSTLKMLLFYGFVLDKQNIVKQIKPLNRTYSGTKIGLYSIHNYYIIKKIMNFLTLIGMEELSAKFFFAMCKAIKSDSTLHKKVNPYLLSWIKTQPYLKLTKTI